ncbi:MAG: hypothetical protein HS108_01260 [Planctomycetes bacterium]|nr:hypothetical protein [Planctomycetota bacterium]MCL4729723.1 hypothetical protein [Planctomycetota bacterium]
MPMRQTLMLVAAGLIGGLCSNLLHAPAGAQEAPAVLRAQRFELVDEGGTVRASLSAAGGVTELRLIGHDDDTNATLRIRRDGSTALTFHDAKQQARMVLGIGGASVGGLAFADAAGNSRLALGTDKAGAPALTMNYASGKLAGIFTVQSERDAAIILNGPKGDTNLALGNSDGRPNILMLDDKGVERMKLVLKEDNAPAWTLRDARGQARLVAGANADGWAGLGITDPKGTVRTLMFSDARGESGLSVSDAAGKSRGALAVTPEHKVRIELLDDAGKTLFVQPRN